MKTERATLLLASIALVAALTAAQAGAEVVRADLNTYASVPTLAGDATGSFKAHIRRNQGNIEYTLSYVGLESGVLQAHIHFGNPWENGGISAFLCTNLGNAPSTDVPACPSPAGTVEGVIEAVDVIGPENDRGINAGDFETFLDAIDAEATYVNVHTTNFPAGEIRGQLQ